jgi:hypothetical protein
MARFNPADAYDAGLRGAYNDPRADEMLVDSVLRKGGNPVGAEVAHQWEFADLGKGKLVTTWQDVVDYWPGCWPASPQDTSDCVSHGSRSAALASWTCELIDGRPDEVTGVVEGKPDVSPEAIADGVLATESEYWWRGHDGGGWTCSGAANALMNDCGIWLRKNYPEIGVDLTRYSGDTAQKWGAKRPPDAVRQIGRQHLVRTATVLKSPEEIRDFLAAGFGVYFCSSLKWSSNRDENGYSPVVPGTWQHCQFCAGYDDRPEIIKLYGEPLVLNGNSWGKNWNSGSRKVYGTKLLIPEGFYWTRASSHRQNTLIALSSVNGWPRRKLKTYGALGRV